MNYRNYLLLKYISMIGLNNQSKIRMRVQVLDDKNVRRRFRASNYQSTTRVKPFICTMPMRLDDGWNQIQFNLSGQFKNKTAFSG